MNNRKNIDTLFQEKFKSFEAIPAENVWHNIEAKLDEKKRKRIIPFWFKFSGVAAILLLGFLLSQFVFNAEIKNQNPAVMDAVSNSVNENKTEKNQNHSFNQNVPDKKSATAVVEVLDEKNQTRQNSANKKTNISFKKTNAATIIVPSENTVTENKPLKHRFGKRPRNSNKSKSGMNEIIVEEKNTGIAQSTNSTDFKEMAQSTEEVPNNNESNKNSTLDELKGSINLNSKIVTTEMKVNDTVTKNSIATNALEELLNEKESKVNQKSKENRWQITSNVAPVFLGSVTNGSPVDSKFEDNSKQYNTNISLGLGVSYALSSRLSIRTGVNKMAVDYNTNDIAFYAALQPSSTMTSLIPASNNATIVVEDAPQNTGIPNESAFFQKNEGYLNQRMGYYEVPVELTYALLNKKFGIKIISGVSTFFLNENKITVVSGNLSSDLGKANNLNDVHFSTNLGLGFKYSIWKLLEFNLEPTFKYQLNTFSSNTGNFKPYVFGLYSGISYKF